MTENIHALSLSHQNLKKKDKRIHVFLYVKNATKFEKYCPMVQNTLRFSDIRRFNLRTRKPEEKPHNYVQNVPKTIRITLKTELYKM